MLRGRKLLRVRAGVRGSSRLSVQERPCNTPACERDDESKLSREAGQTEMGMFCET